jgi:hypothetical protein
VQGVALRGIDVGDGHLAQGAHHPIGVVKPSRKSCERDARRYMTALPDGLARREYCQYAASC